MKAIRNIINYLIIGAAGLLLVLAALFCWHRYLWFHFSGATTKEFYQTLDDQRPSVNLSNIKSVEWDSLAFVSPYSDVCQHGIEGYAPGGPNCFASTDDGECWLLFLQENRLVAKVRIDRRRLDLTTANFPQRLPRNEAKLRILGEGDFASVRIQK